LIYAAQMRAMIAPAIPPRCDLASDANRGGIERSATKPTYAIQQRAVLAGTLHQMVSRNRAAE